MAAYYNEWDPYAAQWLRNLIAAGHLPPGEVDERSITEVQADDLKGFDQCHFFAGIGGWPYALRLALWPDNRPVWTGSCPCQPFSSAGKQGGAADDRHLWPSWYRLIREFRPGVVFGEQVEGAVGFGWIDRVFADMEAENYACGAAVLGAHSVGAPHIRQRLWWVADSNGSGERRGLGQESREASSGEGEVEGRFGERLRAVAGGSGQHGGLADPYVVTGHQGRALDRGRHQGSNENAQHGPSRGEARGDSERSTFWSAGASVACADGKSRRIEPSIQPLAHGVPARVGKLRAAGNAIVPQAAAEFISAFLECQPNV